MPKLVVKREQKSKASKFIITKKDPTNHSYPAVTQNHLLHPVKHEPFHVPSILELEAFFCQGDYYCLDKHTGYLFVPHDIREQRFEPVGQVIQTQTQERNHVGETLIKERKINWFMKYDIDIDDT
jgi:hypothetical protein